MLSGKIKCKLVICIAVGLYVILTGTASAATINVPITGIIQDGIDAANDGDEVVIADGTYTGAGNVNLDFKGKKITVRSANGPAGVIIDCENQPRTRGVLFDSLSEDRSAVLEGVTIRNGSYDFGAGIMITSGASPVIRNVRVENNNATNSGGGINVRDLNSNPLILNSTISGNTAFDSGGGVRIINSADATIVNCLIDGNSAFAGVPFTGRGGGLFVGNASVSVIGSTLSNNTVSYVGGGATIFGAGQNNHFRVLIIGSVISGNTANGAGSKGGGLRFQSIDAANKVEVINSLIYGNSAEVDGAAIDIYRASPTFYNSTITGNISPGVPIINVHTLGVLGENNEGMISALVTFKNSILYGNSDPVMSDADELALDGNSTIVVEYSDVQGGFAGPGNIDADPLFINAAGNDFRLQLGSPAVDAGDNTAVPADVLDLDGDGDTAEAIPYDLANGGRFFDVPEVADTGNGSAPLVDMGAYEINAGSLQFSASALNFDENAGTVTITVTRTGGNFGAVSVLYTISDGTASAGSDYTAANGTLNWADEDAADKSFTITIIDDAIDENDETITLSLSNPTNGAILGTNSTAQLTIGDNDVASGGGVVGGGGGGGGGCFISSLLSD